MNRILIALLVVVFSLSSLSFGEVKVYNIEKATEEALSNNTTLALYGDKIKIAERRVKHADLKAEDYAKKKSSISDTRIANAKVEFLQPLKLRNTLEQLIRSKENQEESITSDVYNQYFQYQMALDGIATKEKSIEFLTKELNQKTKQYELGLITEVALTQYSNSLVLAKSQLDVLESSKLIMEMKFNQLLGKNLEEEFVLGIENIVTEKYILENMDEVVERLQTDSDDTKLLMESMSEIEKEKWIIHGFAISTNSTEDTIQDTINDLEESIATKNKEITNKKRDIEYKVKSDYNNLENTYADITIAEIDLKLSKKLLGIANIKYNNGLINSLELESQKDDFDKKEKATEHARLNYNLAVKTFKDYIN